MCSLFVINTLMYGCKFSPLYVRTFALFLLEDIVLLFSSPIFILSWKLLRFYFYSLPPCLNVLVCFLNLFSLRLKWVLFITDSFLSSTDHLWSCPYIYPVYFWVSSRLDVETNGCLLHVLQLFLHASCLSPTVVLSGLTL